jgi:Protein of unknown function (DUF4246)
MAPIQLGLPGAGLPVNEQPDKALDWGTKTRHRFPYAIIDWSPQPITVRERSMLGFMNQITDKPEWRRKVFDEEIITRWRKESEAIEDFTTSMFNYVSSSSKGVRARSWGPIMTDEPTQSIAELQHKAKLHVDTDIVSVVDATANVAKSDTLVSKDLRDALKKAVAPLENVPDRYKDWHPGSDNKVLDLVHPSLFQLVYGRSRVVTDGKVGVDDCAKWVGKGDVIPVPADEDLQQSTSGLRYHRNQEGLFWSKQFQWLPCDVQFAEGDAVKIASYVNNLHPVQHQQLYPVLEQLIAKAIPLWNETLTDLDYIRPARIRCGGTQYKELDVEFKDRKREEGDPISDSSDEDYNEDEFYEFENQWIKDHRVLIAPEPGEFKAREPAAPTDLRQQFADKGMQVIVKLANIHLTPEKPKYDGGSWHVEGMLNEHICATALYYYDNENITDSRLHFRQKTETESVLEKQYEQNDFEGVEEIYGIEDQAPAIQELGWVTTREGRMLSFPNVLQHRVAPFELVDKTKPGHRKIVALFLVDPYVRVLSTANVPPQQRDWWAEIVTSDGGPIGSLPPELQQKVVSGVEEFPISLEEAKELREKLMKERTVFVDAVNGESPSRVMMTRG